MKKKVFLVKRRKKKPAIRGRQKTRRGKRMSYESVDKIQNLLAAKVFHYATDKKKASGRALGTFIEVITYYLIKNWKLETYAAIERPLPEFANDDITHNVEFTLHGSRILIESPFTREDFR